MNETVARNGIVISKQTAEPRIFESTFDTIDQLRRSGFGVDLTKANYVPGVNLLLRGEFMILQKRHADKLGEIAIGAYMDSLMAEIPQELNDPMEVVVDSWRAFRYKDRTSFAATFDAQSRERLARYRETAFRVAHMTVGLTEEESCRHERSPNFTYHLEIGHTPMPPKDTERTEALKILEAIALPTDSRIISLGHLAIRS